MRPGERREHQLASVRMPLVHRQLVDRFHRFLDAAHLAEVELRIDALREHVHRHRHQVAVAGALAVAEQRSFDALRARHQGEFGGRDAGTAVVVRVQTDDHAVARREVADEPLDLIRIDVRRGHLHGGRQIDDHRFRRCRTPLACDRGGNFHREVEFGAGETLRRILERDVRVVQRR